MYNASKKGFTLVELSIVLVIIGLLIGGILAAQSMITTARIQSFTRQIGQFDAAVMNFKDKFRKLPGDTNSGTFGGAAGDGDGFIEGGAAGIWTGETANFWVHLQTSGLKSEEGTTYVNTSIGTTLALDATRSPQAKAGKNVSFIATGSPVAEVFDLTVAATDNVAANAYVAASCRTMAAHVADTLACTAGFNGADALAIDTKMDDGNGRSGNVAAVATAAVVSVVTPITAEPLGSTYNVTNTDPTYSLAIRMGSAAGNVQ